MNEQGVREAEIEAALQAFLSAGADRGVYYVSTPITTGRRELELMAKLGVRSRQELRAKFRDQWLEQVVSPNERDAVLQADLVTETFALGKVVVNPARISHEHWSQDDYDLLWGRLIEEFPVTIVPVSGWEYSRGSRLEVQLACSLGIAVFDPTGSRLTPEELAARASAADRQIAENGWGGPETALPPFHPEPRPNVVAAHRLELRSAPREAFAREVFSWLVRERNYQLAKFGTELDDKHTLEEGLTPNGWWDHQLSMYFHRARVLGLENINGRQALAKYVATSCGMLESVVRVHGHLPAPAAPSGELQADSGVERTEG